MSAPRVLAVDDNAANLAVIQAFLSPTDVALEFATNGLEAVDAFKSGTFDIVLMDVQMPVMDGISAIRLIRAHELAIGSPRARIHVVSAHGLAEDVRASFNAGADSHIIKPLNLSIVIQAVFGTPAIARPFDLRKR